MEQLCDVSLKRPHYEESERCILRRARLCFRQRVVSEKGTAAVRPDVRKDGPTLRWSVRSRYPGVLSDQVLWIALCLSCCAQEYRRLRCLPYFSIAMLISPSHVENSVFRPLIARNTGWLILISTLCLALADMNGDTHRRYLYPPSSPGMRAALAVCTPPPPASVLRLVWCTCF